MDASPYRRMWNSAYVKLLLLELCLQMGMMTAQPVVSNAALALGTSVTLAGIMAGLSSAISLSLRIVSGRVITRVAPKTMLVASAAILMVSSLVFALFNSVWALGLSRVLYGSGIVVKTVISVAVCVRIVPKENIGQAVAWLGMANVFAVAAGPTLTQFVGLNWGYGCSFLLSGLLFTAGTILCITFPRLPRAEAEQPVAADADAQLAQPQPADAQPTQPQPADKLQPVAADADAQLAQPQPADAQPTQPQPADKLQPVAADADAQLAQPQPTATDADAQPTQPQPADARQTRGIGNFIYLDALPIAFMGFLEGAMFMVVNTLTLTVSVIRDLPETSLFFVVYVIVSFCMRPIMGKLYDRYGFSKVCPPMCFLMTLSMLTFAFTDNVAMVVVDGILFALGQGCLWPCLQAESVRGVPQEKSGLSTNTLLFGVDLGMVVGPMVSGAILDVAGPMWMYLFVTGIGILLTLWTIPYIRIMKKREEAQVH